MKKFENVYYFFGKQELNPHKFIRDTLIAKPDTSHPSGSGTSKLLTIDDLIKDFNNFAFNFNNIDYKCTYHVHNLDTDNKVFKVSFTLYYSKNKLQAAYAFSDLIQTIKTRKKGDFYMTSIIDSLSTYYSERLYSRLASYERSMRSLITAIFIPNYNDAWAENLADLLKEDKKLGKKKSKEFIESVLEELDLSDLESIFFDRKMDINEDNYDKKFNIDKLNTLSKKELEAMIKQYKPVSLWEKEISKYVSIDNPKGTMEKIRGLRNRIAHNKTFTAKNFKELKKALDFIIPKLNEAEAKILDTRDTEVTNQTLRRTLERVRDLKLHEIKLPNTEIIKRLAESIKLVDEALAFKGISEAFKNMDKIPPFPPNFPFNK